jgi:hypothetical protein
VRNKANEKSTMSKKAAQASIRNPGFSSSATCCLLVFVYARCVALQRLSLCTIIDPAPSCPVRPRPPPSPVYGVRGEAIEDGCGEQPFTTALLDDRIRTIALG